MQATTLQNIKRSKGVDADINKLNNSSGISKSEINAAKKLKKYIEQLMFAKKECEKRMTDLGWNIDYNVKNVCFCTFILKHFFLIVDLLYHRFYHCYQFWTTLPDVNIYPNI